MNSPRSLFTLTLLDDGRVLAAGGWVSHGPRFVAPPGSHMQDEGLFTGDCTDTAEVYDPVAGTWTPTGSMNQRRTGHGAVRLRDGRVLVAGGSAPVDGGFAPHFLLTSAEVYDPATGRWTWTGEMANRHLAEPQNLVLLLPTGKVLAPGGVKPDNSDLANVSEVYDPDSGTWEPTGPMVRPRLDPTALLLPSGHVLVVGGISIWDPSATSATTTSWAELYDPDTNSWQQAGFARRNVFEHQLTLLPTGEVLLTGGSMDGWSGSSSASANLYNPTTGQWRYAHSMITPLFYPSAVRLASGRVLVAGTWWEWTTNLNPYAGNSEVYDPWVDTWTPTPVLRHYVFGLGAAVLLPDGAVLYAGGERGDLGTGVPQSPVSAAQLFFEGSP